MKYYIILVRVCVLCYPPCIAHEPYYTVTCDLSASTFFTLCHKEHDFREKKIMEHIVCILIRAHRDNTINVHRYSCKVPVILVRF
jgi:hypothetical protein